MAKEKVEKKVEVKAFPFSVAKGKALTTKRGILGEGKEVKPEYVAGGEATLARLTEAGYIVKG